MGKTFVSSILTIMLKAEYWKPIQAGNLDNSDSKVVQKLSGALCHPETYRLRHALSPHKAAALENMPIEEHRICLPKTTAPLIIETAGGFLSPCSQNQLQGDFFSSWPCYWLLISKAYLGSINHTCLTVEAMRARNLNILGIILNNYPKDEEQWLMQILDLPLLGTLIQEKIITQTTLNHYANIWRPIWKNIEKTIRGSSGTPLPKLR
ncbi:Dethiobiotin synthetase [Candidatus Chlamydia sanziniae]|uniref:Dethiobiotin synthase n=1 Tax=Candidatus Chlamydia sanziniae TaxID=1806891 RepID=A0A1A9HXR9_9CHLA|nr:Dethiobiotin synthetase [Candidatus Chlamydia sanziniae]